MAVYFNNVMVRNADGFEDRRFVFQVISPSVYVRPLQPRALTVKAVPSAPSCPKPKLSIVLSAVPTLARWGGVVRLQTILPAGRVGAPAPGVDGGARPGGQPAQHQRGRRAGHPHPDGSGWQHGEPRAWRAARINAATGRQLPAVHGGTPAGRTVFGPAGR